MVCNLTTGETLGIGNVEAREVLMMYSYADERVRGRDFRVEIFDKEQEAIMDL